MKLIKPSFEIWNQPAGLEGVYKQIERVGRVCYKSEDKITEDSANPFVDKMVKSGHGAMLEHGTVYLKVPTGKYSFLDVDYFDDCDDIKDSFFSNPYTRIHCQEGYYYISTNYRVLVENFSEEFIPELLQYLCEPTEYHERRVTVKFILSRSIAQEYTRHRVFSFAMESQRYCAYNKDKFGNEVTFIIPCWMNEEQKNMSLEDRDICGNTYAEVCFKEGLIKAEKAYFTLLKEGWKPQQAREVLPNACKTELVMTGFVDDWKHFFFLRCPVNAHPQARELAIPLSDEFVKRGYIK